MRAPIPQREEVLIQPGYEGYSINRTNKFRQSRVRTVFDGFRNFSNETSKFTEIQKNLRENLNFHEFFLFLFSESNGASSAKGKKRTLEELFKPPIDIMFKGDFQLARDAATASKKWLMINVQDACEFPCQVLNRDVWSNEAVKTILREHFIFWQVRINLETLSFVKELIVIPVNYFEKPYGIKMLTRQLKVDHQKGLPAVPT